MLNILTNRLDAILEDVSVTETIVWMLDYLIYKTIHLSLFQKLR